MRFLFLKRSLSWPRTTGHDVHTFHMIQALAALGHEVELALAVPPAADAIAGLGLGAIHKLDGRGGASCATSETTRLSYLQHRYLRYWGIDPGWLPATAKLVAERRPNVVVAASYDVLPCLAAAIGTTRVWYAADDYARHQLSMLRLTKPACGT